MRRRALAIAVLLAFAAPASAAAMKSRPQHGAVVASLYAAEQAGRAPLSDPGERARALTPSLSALWSVVEAAAKRRNDGDPPPDFDVVTNSQGSTLKSYALAIERADATHATVIATLVDDNWLRASAREKVVRYDLVSDGSLWRIDDIHGVAEPRAWSLRAILSESLK